METVVSVKIYMVNEYEKESAKVLLILILKVRYFAYFWLKISRFLDALEYGNSILTMFCVTW